MTQRRRSLGVALVAVTTIAVLVRIVALGDRVAHWDEGRVAYFVLQYLHSGAWEYHPIIHGPLLFHVNRWVFDNFGATDFTMRVAVALVGGLLPLSAWLYRERLSRAETLSLAVLLAATPVLLYYSRFFRNDLPLAAAMFVAFGLFVRAADTGRRWYVLAAAVAMGLGFSMKENAVLYPVCWVGALALYGAWRRRRGDDWASSQTVSSRVRPWLGRWGPVALGSLLVWILVVAYNYAPRAGRVGEVGIGRAGADPTLWPSVLREATVESAGKLVAVWVQGGHQGTGLVIPYYFVFLTAIVGFGALAVVAFAAIGSAVEWRTGRPRAVVALAALWGVLSLLGYPFAMDLSAPWIGVHVVVPLAIPAAVGLAATIDRARLATDRPNRVARLAAVALLVVGAQTGAVATTTAYVAADNPLNPLGQPVQATNDLKERVHDVERAACATADRRVLFYGPYFDRAQFHTRHPLPWYFERGDIEMVHADDTTELPATIPPAVVALDTSQGDLDSILADYDVSQHELDPWSTREPDAFETQTRIYVQETDQPPECVTG
ncbi:MAG: flippase activity-associated protein Agl23 [Halobacteriota archaeon]